MKWRVILQGSREDVERLAAELPGQVAVVSGDSGQLEFHLDDPEAGATGKEAIQAVKQAIEAVLDRLNGLGRLRWGRNFRRIEIARIASVDSSGREGQHVFIDPAHAHLLPEEFADMVERMGHPRPSPPEGWEEIKTLNLQAVSKLAEADDEVAQVLHLLDVALEDDADLDWKVAYLAFELIKEDLDQRGIDGQAIGVWTDSRRRLFKHTANSFGALGLRARHAREGTEPPPSPMTDTEASWFLRRVAARWIKQRLGEPLL